jgi:signal transduction histidine kinase
MTGAGEAGILPGRSAASASASRGPARVVLVVAAASVPLGIYGEWAFAHAGATTPTLLYDLTVGWAFVAAGVVASRRQPDSGSGLLMACEGLSWFLTNLQGSGEQALALVGVLVGVLNEAVLAHLVLTFPTGRTSSRLELALVLIIYAIAATGGLAYLDTTGPSYDPYRCQGCTTGVLLFAGDPALMGAAQRAVEASGSIAGLAVIGVVLSRWVNSTVAERRLHAPLWLSLGACTLLTGTHVMAVFQVDLTGTVSQAYVWLSDIIQLAMPFAFLGVALRLRMTRAAVGELVLERGSELSLDGLRAALRRALGDPSVEMGLWHEGSGEYRDSAGRTIALPGAGDRRVANRINWAGGPVAMVVHDQALSADPRLVQTIASALRLVAERARLLEHLQGQLEEVRASRARIAEADDAARRRLERDLHDGAQQRLVTLSMTLASTLRQLRNLPGASDLQATLVLAGDELRQSLAELRELAHGIHPSVLSDHGLAGAIQSLVARMPMLVEVVAVADRFPPPVELTAYYVLCEALTNVARHSGATHARVSAVGEHGRLVVDVVDDGAGGAVAKPGSGLRGIADRVEACGGTLSVQSPPGGGTRLRAELPCA